MRLKKDIDLRRYHPLMGVCEIVVFDLETTGLRSHNNDITQIAAARISGMEMNIEETFDTYVNPGIPIPEETERLNQISNNKVADAPSPLLALQKFCKFSENAVLFGHDIYNFDFKFINKHLNESGSSTKKFHFIDTMDIFQLLWPDFSRLNSGLDEIAARLDISIPCSMRHHADGDVELLTRIFHRIQTDPRLEGLSSHIPVHTGEIPSFDPSSN